MPRESARSATTRGSHTKTTRPAKRSRASSAHRSGPMPAGSPAVSAIRLAFVVPVLDERAVARLAQPVLVGLVGLARANRLARVGALALLGKLVGAPLDRLQEVPAERRLHRLAHLAVLQLVHDALEFGHGVARGDPAEVAALRGARILGVDARELGEIGARHDALAQPREPGARVRVAHALARAQQDVAH